MGISNLNKIKNHQTIKYFLLHAFNISRIYFTNIDWSSEHNYSWHLCYSHLMRCGYIHFYRDTLHMIKLQAPTYEYQIFFDYKVKVFRYIFKQPKLLMTRVERIKIFEYHLKKKIPKFLFLNSYSLVLQAKYFLYNALKEFFPFLPFLFQFLYTCL